MGKLWEIFQRNVTDRSKKLATYYPVSGLFKYDAYEFFETEINYLKEDKDATENPGLGMSASTIASLLFHLEPARYLLGNYLGESKEFNMAVMKAYMELIDLHCSFDEALRELGRRILLPAVSRQNDEFVLWTFAQVYNKQNPRARLTTEQVYILVQSVLDLTQNLVTNKSMNIFAKLCSSTKMKKADFVKRSNSRERESPVPLFRDDFLEDIYDRVADLALPEGWTEEKWPTGMTYYSYCPKSVSDTFKGKYRGRKLPYLKWQYDHPRLIRLYADTPQYRR